MEKDLLGKTVYLITEKVTGQVTRIIRTESSRCLYFICYGIFPAVSFLRRDFEVISEMVE